MYSIALTSPAKLTDAEVYIGDLYPLVGEEESFEEISVCGLQGGIL